MTNGSGTIVERYAYTAYGAPTFADASGNVLTASAYSNRYTYTGREWDGMSHQYHYRARFYDASLGRFCSRDPMAYAGADANLFAYVGATPITAIDPTGLIIFEPEYYPPPKPKPKPAPTPKPSEEQYAISQCYCSCAGISALATYMFTGMGLEGAIRTHSEEYADQFFPHDSRENSALRHCVAGGLMAAALGCACAQCLEDYRDIAQYYDSWPNGQSWANTQQAIYNDREGRFCAGCRGQAWRHSGGAIIGGVRPDPQSGLLPGSTPSTIESCCLTKMNQGKLHTGNPVTGIQPHPMYPTIWPRVPHNPWWLSEPPEIDWGPDDPYPIYDPLPIILQRY